MSNDEMKKFAELVKTIVKEEVEPVNKKLDSLSKEVAANTEELKSVSEQVGVLTVKVDGEIIPTLETHTKLLKKIVASTEKNTENVDRLDKRLSSVEASDGIHPPSEHHIVR